MRAMWCVLALALACGDDSSMDGDAGGRRDGSTSDVGAPDAAGRDGARSDTSFDSAVSCGDVPLTDWEQKMLDDHNRWRAMVEPAAADMHRIYWDRLIAENAAAWVASCDPDWPHSPQDSRANIGGYEALGENLSFCAGTGCIDDPRVADGSGMGDADGWWEERLDYNYAADESTGGVVTHYTQMTSSNVYAMGCATQRCGAPGPFGWDGEWWWTICQYGPRGQAYWVGTRPYETGEGGLVEPGPEVFEVHPGLCGPE